MCKKSISISAYKATDMELINALSNITPVLVESTIDSALEIKSNKFKRKIYSTDSDAGDSHKKDYDIQVQMKRAGKQNVFSIACNKIYVIKR